MAAEVDHTRCLAHGDLPLIAVTVTKRTARAQWDHDTVGIVEDGAKKEGSKKERGGGKGRVGKGGSAGRSGGQTPRGETDVVAPEKESWNNSCSLN